MERQQKHIPQLRFPEFQNDGEWEVKRLGDCLIQAPDYGLNSPAVPYSTNLPTYLRITDISDDGFFIKEGKTSVDTVLTNENSLQEGDIVFARTGASVGKVYKYRKEDGPLVFAGFLIRIKPDKTKLNSDFLFQFLFSNTYNRWVEVTSTRSGQPGINSADIASLQIPLPTLVEQQHIANVLSEIDTLLSATKDKLEQLKAYKKGLMQKLFPAHGKTLPEYRFKEFEKDGEWKVKKLGELIVVNSGKDYKHLNHGNIPVFGTGGYMLSVDDKLSDVDAVGIGRKGTIDKPQYLKAPFWTVDTLFFLTEIGGNDIRFIYYLSQTIPWKKYGEQTGVPSLSKVSIENLEVIVPSSTVEQNKIVQTLLSLDEEIDSLSKKRESIENYKNGLIQQLFTK